MPVETRYMRSDTHQINGLSAYKLGTEQSAAALSVSTVGKAVGLEATLRPSSDIYTSFPVLVGVPRYHWDAVDDITADDDVTYVRTGDSTTEVYDRFGKGTFTLPSGKKIAFISVTCRGVTDYLSSAVQASFRFGVYIGTTYYMSAYKKTNGLWQTFSQDWVKNPATGLAWTQDDINNLQIAISGKSYYYGETYYYAAITQVYLEVYTYADDTVYYSVDILLRSADGSETYLAVANSAQWSGLISSLFDSPGLKSATVNIPTVNVQPTDAVVVRVYQKVGSGTWNLVREFITEQLGASSLDAAVWTVYYYLDISADTSYVYTVYWHGTSTYNSRIENFTWTPVPVGIYRYIGDGLAGAVFFILEAAPGAPWEGWFMDEV